ncbi:MAG: tRNA (adenosine(37)-N6)-threonylcarbamoyltransferase complex transferase subunit TsaD [Chitinophagales bacterium]|nr:tRNA (adenosine(37)-N6)-threonylcarbamoyltransferase complex transferase subunit TsaD [Hyphomicrobiales bacterium]
MKPALTAKSRLIILGIETSCDETAAAVVARAADGRGAILSNVIRSQIAEHADYGGVVPEIAARAHLEVLDTIILAALADARVSLDDIDCVAATAGPGLIGGLLVGLTMGKAIAAACDLPFVAVNHLEAHALTVGLTEGLQPPYLLLLVSGGHTQLIAVHEIGRYEQLGATLDDAAGEVFDKTAKLLGLEFPGGPAVELWAAKGNAARFAFPRPMMGRLEPDFSFSGLKTSLRHAAAPLAPMTDCDIADLCASFQAAVAEAISDRVSAAMKRFAAALPHGAQGRLVAAGGVAANAAIRDALAKAADARGFMVHFPPIALCTDNAAMIAWAGAERLARGWISQMNAPARPRWPLRELTTDFATTTNQDD